MSAHTPGPWMVGGAFDNYGETEIVIERMTKAGNMVIAVAIGGLRDQVGNASLIAAAPDLLEALQYAIKQVPELADVPGIAAAIAKATGDQT